MSGAARTAGARGELALELPPSPSSVAVARRFAARVAREAGVPQERVRDLEVALSEAVTNAVRAHAAAGRPGVPVAVLARREGGRCVLEVADAGGGLARLGSPAEASGRADHAGTREGGLGLLLIRALFPGASFVHNGRGGTTVRLEVARPSSASAGTPAGPPGARGPVARPGAQGAGQRPGEGGR